MKYKKRLRVCKHVELMKPDLGHIVLHSRTSLKGRQLDWAEVHPEGFSECYKFPTTPDMLRLLALAKTARDLRETCVYFVHVVRGLW